MNRKKVLTVLFFAVVCAAVATYLALAYLREPAGPAVAAASELSVIDVVVATKDLDLGTVLTEEHLKVVDWPAESMPDGYAGSPVEVIGRGLLQPVSGNEPILVNKLAPKEAGGGLSIIIPPGKRAMSVRVDDVVGVAGFARPGTRVDVVVTLTGASTEQDPATRLILQNIQVLAAGQTIQRDIQGEPETVPVVTLMVSPEEGEVLALAATEGQVQLALRNALDMEEVETPGVRIASLYPRSRRVPTPIRRATPPDTRTRVQLYRGARDTTYAVQKADGSDASDGS
jgi:pilus assembly protein CpaB